MERIPTGSVLSRISFSDLFSDFPYSFDNADWASFFVFILCCSIFVFVFALVSPTLSQKSG